MIAKGDRISASILAKTGRRNPRVAMVLREEAKDLLQEAMWHELHGDHGAMDEALRLAGELETLAKTIE